MPPDVAKMCLRICSRSERGRGISRAIAMIDQRRRLRPKPERVGPEGEEPNVDGANVGR